MPKQRGANGRMQISLQGTNQWYWLGFQRIELGDKTTPLPVTDSELRPGNPVWALGGDDTYTSGRADAFVAKIGDLREGTVRFTNATWSDENNMFGPPLYIASGRWYSVALFPNRTLPLGQATYFWMGNLLCASASVTMMIPGAQPVSIDFETDGSFRLPNELAG